VKILYFSISVWPYLAGLIEFQPPTWQFAGTLHSFGVLTDIPGTHELIRPIALNVYGKFDSSFFGFHRYFDDNLIASITARSVATGAFPIVV